MLKAKLDPVLLSLMILVVFANVTWSRRGRIFNRLAAKVNENDTTAVNQAGRAIADGYNRTKPTTRILNTTSLKYLYDSLACNLTDCNAQLDCRSYTICKSNADPDSPIEPDRMVGTYETITCPQFTYPQEINVTTNVPGKIALVACLEWDKINAARKLEISMIPGCYPCQFKSKTPCSSQFKYINENGVESTDWEQCPDHLVIDIQRRSCVRPCIGTNKINKLCRDNGLCNNPPS